MLDARRLAVQSSNMTTKEFWKTKALAELNDQEWEALCDGCGKCCLAKLEDEETGEIYWTGVGCRLFDGETCRCSDYENRLKRVPDCVRLTPENVGNIPWLPSTCGYRLVAEGKDLPWWHPLVSGDQNTVHEAGISIRGRVKANEAQLAEPEDYFAFILDEEP
ncbi:YcgN family cysteine cluster protein [Nitratireductor kimnyeongensis]|nr:YcgN family cysteine cluster protein [Nitratireductor kimnyeongensis]QZZ36005.1 YcgN family cysteine cluster protein [Nitratireductor kimnyeongensis]